MKQSENTRHPNTKAFLISASVIASLAAVAMIMSGGGVALAQQTGNATTISNTTSTDTFTAKGLISGTISEGGQSGQQPSNATSGNATQGSSSSPYLVAGDWNMQVDGGNVTDFAANFTMVRTDGTEHHSHDITNFRTGNNTNVELDPKGMTTINGTADIATNGTSQWPGTDTTLSINMARILTIEPSEDAQEHFKGQPIYGVVTSITGENGTQIATTAPAGGNQTQQGNQTQSNPLDQLTQPFEDLFGGG